MCRLKDHLFIIDRFIHKHRMLIENSILFHIVMFILGVIMGSTATCFLLSIQ